MSSIDKSSRSQRSAKSLEEYLDATSSTDQDQSRSDEPEVDEDEDDEIKEDSWSSRGVVAAASKEQQSTRLRSSATRRHCSRSPVRHSRSGPGQVPAARRDTCYSSKGLENRARSPSRRSRHPSHFSASSPPPKSPIAPRSPRCSQKSTKGLPRRSVAITGPGGKISRRDSMGNGAMSNDSSSNEEGKDRLRLERMHELGKQWKSLKQQQAITSQQASLRQANLDLAKATFLLLGNCPSSF